MSTTERELRSEDGPDDALDELFDEDDFTAAFERAIDSAELDLQIGDIGADPVDVADARDDLDDVRVIDPGALVDTEIEVDDQADIDVDDTSDIEDVDDTSDIEDDVDHSSGLGLDDEDEAEAAIDFPVIVPATPDDEPDADESASDDPQAREPNRIAPAVPPGEVPDVDDPIADELLEELRRARIDGPIVDVEPQDETAGTKRRPRRSADYDPAPVPIPVKVPRVLGRKPRVRRVTRVVRHVDPWSVFKIAIVAHLVLYVIVLTASVLLWNVAHATGTVGNVERFFESFGWDEFEFQGGEIYRAAWIGGLFAVVGLTGLAVLAATLFNLITDLVGGVRFTVLEEEVVETRVSPMRRFVIRRPEPTVPATMAGERGSVVREVVVDDSGAIERPTR
ncbi:MAG: DUF3566 domain-containing protein [Actinomycetota bacterium]